MALSALRSLLIKSSDGRGGPRGDLRSSPGGGESGRLSRDRVNEAVSHVPSMRALADFATADAVDAATFATATVALELCDVPEDLRDERRADVAVWAAGLCDDKSCSAPVVGLGLAPSHLCLRGESASGGARERRLLLTSALRPAKVRVAPVGERETVLTWRGVMLSSRNPEELMS